MAGFLVIAGPGVSDGFRLAGFECLEAGPEDDMTSLIERVYREARYGLICIESGLLDRVSRLILKRLKKRALPVILPIDLPLHWEEGTDRESHIEKLIRRAVGYQIKIKK
ncbi:MAG: V-type ATP synthase subunit F [Deltaproteobacteria bacterium]|nr:V-type ATP synthase subunit F [Deltaproteobacteria bacterium]